MAWWRAVFDMNKNATQCISIHVPGGACQAEMHNTLILKVNEFCGLNDYLSRAKGKEYREWRDAGKSDKL